MKRKRTHESRENRGWGGSQFSRDQNNKRENTWEHRKQRLGRVPVKPRSKRKKREHMKAEKEGGGWVPVKTGLKQCKQRTLEMQYMVDFDATIAAAGYWDTDITQEHAPQKKRDGSQLSRDQNNQRERERERERERTHESTKNKGWGVYQFSRDQNEKNESTWEQRKKGVGESQLSRDSKIANKGHMRCNRWVISMQR